jgi:exportin-T
LYALGESLSDEAIKTGSGLLGELVPTLISTRFQCHFNRLVALVYLETITRYIKFVQEHTEYVPMVLTAFLDERGIHHPNFHVRRRASYLFMRVVKLLKAKLVPFIESILQVVSKPSSCFMAINCL